MLLQKVKMKWELWCSLVIMPTEEEDNSEQPVSCPVLLFGCKGMIEAIVVLLFLWLLVLVLFTKQHEGKVDLTYMHTWDVFVRQVVDKLSIQSETVWDFRYKYCISRLAFTVLLLNTDFMRIKLFPLFADYDLTVVLTFGMIVTD